MGSTTFIDMFAYSQAGQVLGKRLRVKKVQPYSNGTQQFQTAVGDLNLGYGYNSEGKMSSVSYPAGGPSYTYSFGGMMRPAGMTDQSNTAVLNNVSLGPANELLSMNMRVTRTRLGSGQPQTASGDLGITYAYQNAEGKLTSVTYPGANNSTAPAFNYSYDSMMRPSGMTDQGSYAVVSGVSYGVANELLSMNYTGVTETRTYNSLLQMMRLQITGSSALDISYNFVGGAGNGKIASQVDNRPGGETITYQYDALNRLIAANSTGNWSQSYTYDGFGNLTNRATTVGTNTTTNPTPVDAGTNRLTSGSYDANGNFTNNGAFGYDSENRLVNAVVVGSATYVQYGYDAQNKRVWQGNFSNSCTCLTSETVSLFGADGKLIGTYTPAQSGTTLTFTVATQRVYFGGKLVGTLDAGGTYATVPLDRLGSQGKYYPYGEERSQPLANDQVKFATYTRDSATGLDYADQRYYASTFGRFMTADPYRASGGPSDPGSWNRYAYVEGDPVNYLDASGLYKQGIWFGPLPWILIPIEVAGGDPRPQRPKSDSEPRGGSGGGSSLSSQMRIQMRDAVLGLGPGCQKTLGSVNLDLATPPMVLGGGQVNLLTALGQTDGLLFFDITGAQGQLTLSQAGIVDPASGQPYAIDPTLATFFGDQTKFVARTSNNAVLLGKLFFGQTAADQAITLVHEDLHAVFNGTSVGGDDVDIANYFNIAYDKTLTGDALVTAASQAITGWLKSDCGANK